MDYEKLIERLNNHLQSLTAYSDPELAHTLGDAATFLSALQAENKRLKSLLSEGGQDLWSKENQRADRLEAENEKLRAELEQVKHQRDSYRMYHDDLVSKPNCNTCADKDCKYRPIPGDTVRANCLLWRGSEEGEQDG
jgi:chromosome segregation ATPase